MGPAPARTTDYGRFVESTKNLSEDILLRVVAHRARELFQKEIDPLDARSLGRQESDIADFFEKVHQTRDFLPVRFLADGAKRSEAVCRISTSDSFGTGFLVAKGILLTNNHVLGSAEDAADSRAEFGLETGQNPRSVALRPDTLFVTDADLDFTVVGCDTVGIENIEPIKLLRSPATVARNEAVNIIQHPNGRPKEIAIHNNPVTEIRDKVIRYRTDTEPGSSGSPVFNNRWDLVALHHAGFPDGANGASNEGIRIPSIVSRLETLAPGLPQNHEALRRLLSTVTDTSPLLGFFEIAGIGTGSLEVQVNGFQGTPAFADIGVWNIEHFNNQVSNERVEDVASVIARLNMDVIGLVEVERGALTRLKAALANRGLSVAFDVQDTIGSAQDVGVLFDRNTTTVAVRADLVRKLKDQLSARTASGGTAFPRVPLFAECTVGAADGKEVRFIMIVVHLKAFGDPESRARRRLAAEKLTEMIGIIREAEGLPVVLGGDFNEQLNNSVLQPLKDSPDLFAMTTDDADDGAISFVGTSHRSLIDHVVVSKDVQLGEISNDDAAIVRLDRSVADFADRVSDHVPVVFRMVLR